MEKKFELLSNSAELAGFREELKKILATSGMAEKKSGEVVLAMDEVLTNILRHGYDHQEGRVEVFVRDEADRIEILIRDYGKEFDPTRAPAPELPPTRPGGLGIHFIKTVMDKVEYERSEAAANELHLTKMKS